MTRVKFTLDIGFSLQENTSGIFGRSEMGLYAPVKYRIGTSSAFIYSIGHNSVVLGCVGIVAGWGWKRQFVYLDKT